MQSPLVMSFDDVGPATPSNEWVLYSLPRIQVRAEAYALGSTGLFRQFCADCTSAPHVSTFLVLYCKLSLALFPFSPDSIRSVHVAQAFLLTEIKIIHYSTPSPQPLSDPLYLGEKLCLKSLERTSTVLH